jgi:branched-chain amino acid transport system substrate-binding protein
MHILKEAIERAGSADREAIAKMLHTMDLSESEAADVWPGGVSFDKTGMRKDADVMLVQWQKGSPVLIWPLKIAAAKGVWHQ